MKDALPLMNVFPRTTGKWGPACTPGKMRLLRRSPTSSDPPIIGCRPLWRPRRRHLTSHRGANTFTIGNRSMGVSVPYVRARPFPRRSTLTSTGHTGSHHLLPTNPQGSTRPSIRSRHSDPLPPVAVPRESQSKLSHVPLRQLLQSESSSSIIDASPVYRLKGVDGRARRASLSEHVHQELCERLSKDGILASR